MKSKLFALAACIVLTACSAQAPIVHPTDDPLVQTNTHQNDDSTEIPTEIPQTEATEIVYYEIISPETINTEGGFQIILNSAYIEIHPVMGTMFHFGFRYLGLTKAQIPDTRWEYVDPPFITDLQIFRGEDEVPIRLDVGGIGGGSNTTEDGEFHINQGQTYYFPDDFTVGQVEQIVVLVTFHEMFGIPTPVRYEFNLEPLQGPLG